MAGMANLVISVRQYNRDFLHTYVYIINSSDLMYHHNYTNTLSGYLGGMINEHFLKLKIK